MTGLLGAVALLTRLPVDRHPATARDLAGAVPWFPAVGFFVGVATAGLYAATLPLLTPLVAAVLALAGQVVLTGAFHEDGLGDLADAAGGSSVADRLRILDDPRHGTYGVLAIVVVAVLRVATLSSFDAWQAMAIVPAAHALGRGGAVAVMGAFRPAIVDGLGASFTRALRPGQVAAGVGLAAALGAAAVGVWVVVAGLLVAAGAAVMGNYARRTLGGTTGDVLGAVAQVGELCVLLVGVAVVANGWTSPAWWR